MKILLCTDGSAHSHAASDLLLRIPLPQATEVTVLSVVEAHAPFAGDGSHIAPEERDALQKIRDVMRQNTDECVSAEAERLRGSAWTVRQVTRRGEVGEQIAQAAQEFGSDLIVLGALGQSDRKRGQLGNNPRRVLKYASCSVLVARPTPEPTDGKQPLKILVAFDGSPSANAGVTTLASLPLQDRAEVTVLTVLTVATTLYRRDVLEKMSATWQKHKRDTQRDLEAAVTTLKRATPNVSSRIIESGPDASDAVLTAAGSMGADIVLVGHSGKTRVKELLQGSVSRELMESAPCSAWVVKE